MCVWLVGPMVMLMRMGMRYGCDAVPLCALTFDEVYALLQSIRVLVAVVQDMGSDLDASRQEVASVIYPVNRVQHRLQGLDPTLHHKIHSQIDTKAERRELQAGH